MIFLLDYAKAPHSILTCSSLQYSTRFCRYSACRGCTAHCRIRRCICALLPMSKSACRRVMYTKCKFWSWLGTVYFPEYKLLHWPNSGWRYQSVFCDHKSYFHKKLYSITNVRETRLATLVAHILILISTFSLLPYPLQWIPTSVLHGLFLYMALTSLAGNEMFERMLLLITEQARHH